MTAMYFEAYEDVLPGGLHVVDGDLDLVADQLLPEELPGLEHEGDVVERPEVWAALHLLAVSTVLLPGRPDGS